MTVARSVLLFLFIAMIQRGASAQTQDSGVASAPKQPPAPALPPAVGDAGIDAQPPTAAVPDAGPVPAAAIAPAPTVIYVVAPPAPPEAPPPVPPVRQGRHGFFSRLALGGGGINMSESVNGTEVDTIDGTGFAFDLAIGGGVTPQFVIAGHFAFQQMSRPDLHAGGRTVTAQNNGNVGMLGVMLEGYPSPASGLHIGGSIGAGRFTITDQDGSEVIGAGGFGYAAMIGYDFPLGRPWHLGVDLRLLGTQTDYEGSHQSALAWALMADAMVF